MTEDNAIRNIVIMVILAVAVITSFGSFIGDFSPGYNVTANTSFVNKSQEYSDTLETSATDLRGAITKIRWWNPLGWFEGMIAIMSLLWNAGSTSANFFIELPTIFGLGTFTPFTFIAGIIFALVILVVAFELVSAVIKRGV